MSDKEKPPARVKARKGRGTQSSPNEGSKVTTKANTPQDSPPPDGLTFVQALAAAKDSDPLQFLVEWSPDGPWPLAAINPKSRAIQAEVFTKATFERIKPWIDARSGKFNMYHGVSPTLPTFTGDRAKKTDIAAMAWLHVDIDARPPNPQMTPDEIAAHLESEYERIYQSVTAKLPVGVPPPTMIVYSGGGVQVFWKLETALEIGGDKDKANDAALYNVRLQERLDGDSCQDISRIMRLPWTLNIPDEKKRAKGRKSAMAKVLHYWPERVYPLSAFSKASAEHADAGAGDGAGAGSAKAKGGKARFGIARFHSTEIELDVLLATLAISDERRTKLKLAITDPERLAESEPAAERKRDPSRNGIMFRALMMMAAARMDPADMKGLLLDPAWPHLSAHILDPGRKGNKPEAYAEQQIRDALKKVAAPDGAIVMDNGRLVEIVDAAQAALLAADTPIYQRGGELVRATRLSLSTEPKDGGITRHLGAVVLLPVRDPWLQEQMARVAKWFVPTEKGLKPADPFPKYAKHLLARAGEWQFPILHGVLTSPTLAGDGRIIEQPGYDEASGLLLDIVPGSFPPVPPSPSKKDAEKALARLDHLLRGFPFVSDASRSVALSALLTATVRASLRTAPLHAFDAPTAGTGKGKLAEMPGLLASGLRPPAMSQGKSPEEDEKRLSTVLRAGDTVILIDNCNLPVEGDFLCMMMTQEMVQARILGLSERMLLPSTALVLATGNNLTLAGDMTRRSVLCRMDAGVERPEEREFDFDCQAELLAARPEFVVDALTVLRAYRLASKQPKLRPMGSFDDWEWIRGALVWLGRADPAETRSNITDSDPDKGELLEIMGAWAGAYGERTVTVGEIHADAIDAPADSAVHRLHRLLLEATKRKEWSGKSVGWYLRGKKGRVIGERCLKPSEVASTHQLAWTLIGGGKAEVSVVPF